MTKGEKVLSLRQINFMKNMGGKIEIQKDFPGSNRDIKIFLRRVARSIGGEDTIGYFTPIEITDDSDSESHIPVDNLGKWLWGLKDYPPHLLVDNDFGAGVVTLYYPKKAPEEVKEFLLALKKEVENNI